MSEESPQARADQEMIRAMFAGYDSSELNATMEAERDVLGSKAAAFVVPKDKSTIDLAVKGMKEALASIPEDQKSAYLDASERAPLIVETESPMSRFLLACDFNYWAAADRLVQYWNERKSIFQDRYLLPITIAEGVESALCEDAKDVIRSGSYAIARPDRYGRPVIFTDFETLPNSWFRSGAVRIQTEYYFLQTISESELGIVNGAIHVACMARTEREVKFKPDGAGFRFCLSTSIPTKPCAGHMLAFRKRSFLEGNFLFFSSCVESMEFVKLRLRGHFCETKQSMLESIRNYGLSEFHLPDRVGGKLNGNHWVQGRIALETSRFVARNESSEDNKLPVKRGHDFESEQKRKMEGFRSWADDFLSKQRIAELEREVECLKQKKLRLNQKEAFLQAQVSCTRHVADCFERDQKVLLQCLRLPEMQDEIKKSQDLKQHQGESTEFFFRRYLHFLGREPVSGKWLLEPKNGLTEEEEHFSQNIISILLGELEVGCGGSNDVHHASAVFEDDIEGYLPNKEPQETLSAIQSLSKQKVELERSHRILSSAVVFASELGAAYEKYRSDQIDGLAGFFTAFFHYYTGKSPTSSMGPLGSFAIANDVLSTKTHFNGSDFVNPIVNLAMGSLCGHEEAAARALALDCIKPALAAVGYDVSLMNQNSDIVSTVNRNSDIHDALREAEQQDKHIREAKRKKARIERKKSLKRL